MNPINKVIDIHTLDLHSLFKSRIVQQYPPVESYLAHESMEMELEPPLLHPSIFQQLCGASIVSDYERMDEEVDCRHDDNQYEVGEQKRRLNMLDSSGDQIPSRRSSPSSHGSIEKTYLLKTACQWEQEQVKQKHHGHNLHFRHPNTQKRKNKQDSQAQQKQEKMEKIKKIQQVGCNCRKSKCLKMYCECFNLQILCQQNCCCVGCGNVSVDESHKKAVLEALTRNPKAFTVEKKQIQAVFDLGIELEDVKKGCKCRKTKCLKKYCQCYNSGEKCGKFCQCDDCCNGESDSVLE